MRKSAPLFMVIILFACMTLSISGCGCGFDCNNGNNRDEPTLLSLGFSDAIPEELKQVVIEVDSITFKRTGAENVVIDAFTIDALGLVDADSFQIDLLQYRGRNQLLVIEDLELDKGTYSEILITLIDGDINFSYAQESDDSLKQINAPAAGLSLAGITLSEAAEKYTVEFGLAQSLQYQSSSDDYLLAVDGIHIEDNATAASLTGRVDRALFNTVSPCNEKVDPESGNRVYLFAGTGLTSEQLADVFTSASSSAIPADSQAPFSVAALVENSLIGSWEYAFGFLPPGTYTMAFACDTFTDGPVNYDGLVVPLPTDQIYEITLSDAEQKVCDINSSALCE